MDTRGAQGLEPRWLAGAADEPGRPRCHRGGSDGAVLRGRQDPSVRGDRGAARGRGPLTVWRAKINSGYEGVDWDGAKEYCRRAGVVGVGWGMPSDLNIPDRSQLPEVVEAMRGVGWS